MDVLHRKIFRPEDVVYFFRSSVEHPHFYLKFKGTVKEVTTKEERVFYRIRVTEVLESYDTAQKYLNRARFRVKSTIDDKYIDKYMYSFDIDPKEYPTKFVTKYQQYWFDVPALFTFSSEQELTDELGKVNTYIITKYSSLISQLSNRT